MLQEGTTEVSFTQKSSSTSAALDKLGPVYG